MKFLKLSQIFLLLLSILINPYTSCKLSTKLCYHKLISKHTSCKHNKENPKKCCEKLELSLSSFKKSEAYLLFLFFFSTRFNFQESFQKYKFIFEFKNLPHNLIVKIFIITQTLLI